MFALIIFVVCIGALVWGLVVCCALVWFVTDLLYWFGWYVLIVYCFIGCLEGGLLMRFVLVFTLVLLLGLCLIGWLDSLIGWLFIDCGFVLV